MMYEVTSMKVPATGRSVVGEETRRVAGFQ